MQTLLSHFCGEKKGLRQQDTLDVGLGAASAAGNTQHPNTGAVHKEKGSTGPPSWTSEFWDSRTAGADITWLLELGVQLDFHRNLVSSPMICFEMNATPKATRPALPILTANPLTKPSEINTGLEITHPLLQSADI